MQLEINKTVYDFKFGVKFVRCIDEEVPITAEGITFGLGLASKIIPELQSGNINTLSRVLVMANKTEKPTLTEDIVDNYIDEHENIEKLFDEVMKELSESNSGKLAMKNFKANLNKK